jgi:hypothetical protein
MVLPKRLLLGAIIPVRHQPDAGNVCVYVETVICKEMCNLYVCKVIVYVALKMNFGLEDAQRKKRGVNSNFFLGFLQMQF